MAKDGKWDYCITCGKFREYRVKKILRKEWIRGREYEFEFTVAVCKGCGQEMDIPGMMDLNMEEMDNQYRKKEGILSVEEIERVWEVCLARGRERLQVYGVEEEMICHYLNGQVPTKEESKRLQKVLRDIGRIW